MAATNEVQAMKENTTTIALDGKTVETPPALVYGGTTYVQLYSIQQALKQAGFSPAWDGSHLTFSMTTPTLSNDVKPLSGGSIDPAVVEQDIATSLIHFSDRLSNVDQVLNDSRSTVPNIEQSLQNVVTALSADEVALNGDHPADPTLQSYVTQYVKILSDYAATFTEQLNALQTNDTTLATRAETDATADNTELLTFVQAYTATGY